MIRYLFDTEGSMVPVDTIHQHPMNDNNGDVDEIIASVETNGVYRKLVVSEATRNILAGNHTYLALCELGAQFVPVEWVEVNKWQELRILAVDNWVARMSRPDPALTRRLVDEIIDLSPIANDVVATLTGTGISRDQYLGLIKDPTPLDLSRIGRETLQHRIKCPECGHEWARQSGEFL
jgi:hypothetical protein